MKKEQDDQSRVVSLRSLPSAGSTASTIWRYVNAYAVLSSVFSVVLAANVLFWFPRTFGIPILHSWAASGYVVCVVLFQQVYLAMVRAVNRAAGRTEPMQAWRYETKWALASPKSDAAVDPSVADPGTPTPRD